MIAYLVFAFDLALNFSTLKLNESGVTMEFECFSDIAIRKTTK